MLGEIYLLGEGKHDRVGTELSSVTLPEARPTAVPSESEKLYQSKNEFAGRSVIFMILCLLIYSEDIEKHLDKPPGLGPF